MSNEGARICVVWKSIFLFDRHLLFFAAAASVHVLRELCNFPPFMNRATTARVPPLPAIDLLLPTNHQF